MRHMFILVAYVTRNSQLIFSSLRERKEAWDDCLYLQDCLGLPLILLDSYFQVSWSFRSWIDPA